MRVNVIRGWFGWAHQWIKNLEETAWFRYLGKPAILGVPPLLITAFYGNKGFTAIVVKEVPLVADLLLTQPGWAILFAAVYPGTIAAVTQSLAKRVEPKGPDVEGLLTLLAALDGVVGAKLNRFASHFANRDKLTKETAFCEITHPEKQIDELVRGICEYFNASQPTKQRRLIRVVLAVLDKGNVVALPIFFPLDEPVKATVEELNRPRSALQIAAKSKKILILEDIAKEVKRPEGKRRYVTTESEDDHSGSLICYPVVFNHTREVPFVISIHCEQEGFFKNPNAELYALSLQRFALRLCLEYSLQQLKESLCE